MLFALGFIAGIVACTFMAVVLILLRKPLLEMAAPIVSHIQLMGVRDRGFIVAPRTDADEAREAKIRENAEQGKDTPISELM